MEKKGLILVVGATGRQGGTVARQLLASGWEVRALTRDPAKPQAIALADLGAEVLRGDLEDRASLEKAARGACGVFAVTDWSEAGVEGEVRQGRNLVDAARDAGVRHFIYSSVGGAERRSGIPHFESKRLVESHLELEGPPATIFRPVFFMYNFESPMFDGGRIILEGKLPMAMRPDRPLQMLAPEDLAVFVAMALDDPLFWKGRALELAGDELTMPQAAEAFSRVIGRKVEFEQVPLERIEQMSPEVGLMFRWFNEEGYRADLAALRSLHPGLLSLEAWLRRRGWDRRAPRRAA